jgi:hypothetical protein
MAFLLAGTTAGASGLRVVHAPLGAPQAPLVGAGTPLPILAGATWAYFKGTVEPPATWNTIAFNDASWLTGPSGFGYGDGDDATVLSDMQNGYLSVYTRRQFDVPNPAAIAGLELRVNWDDGFVAFINGQEVARRNLAGTAGTPVAHDIVASSHEQGTPVTIALSSSMLVAGTNVIAVQGHNRALDSTDLSLLVELRATNPPPAAPTGFSPVDGATGVSTSPNLCVNVSDPNDPSLTVTFHGREVTSPAAAPFTIIAVPDTQFYAESFPATYLAQTQWIRDNRLTRNIQFITQLGDCTNVAATIPQWTNADAAWDIVEVPAAGLPDGMPYGIAVGNHDQTPAGDPGTLAAEGSTTQNYNTYFGISRYLGRGYYGGHYGSNYDNHYELFSAGGMEFIAVHMEYMPSDTTLRQAVLNWADSVLKAFPTRRAILTAHYFLNPSDATWGNQGQATWDALKDNHNVFLMLSGHLDQANNRYEEFTDGTGTTKVNALVSDYQTRPNGGNGWLRIMTFHPDTDTIDIETYSPNLGIFIDNHVDNTAGTARNRLTIAYDMQGGEPYAPVGSSPGPNNSQVCVPWPGRQGSTTYEWYAVVSDGASSTTGATRTFTTGAGTCTVPADCNDGNPCTTESCVGNVCQYSPVAGCCVTAADCNDGNVCTNDACNAGTCGHSNNTVSCDDGNGCTIGDTCSAGSCSGLPNPCDDANACTVDSCAAGACVNAYSPQPGCCATSDDCDDGALCSADTCQGGTCVNTAAANCCDTDAQCADGDPCTADTCTPTNTASLIFNGTTSYVSMGTAPGLGAAQFTVETWFKRTGTGDPNQTGTNGVPNLVPLVAKGAPESDGSSIDANYVLGIDDDADVLAADFEDTATGANHPVYGTTPIQNDVWYHAAATYDGTTWRLYLNGDLETTSVVGAFTPRSDSVQPFALGTMHRSAQTPLQVGFFSGELDEVRVWNLARLQGEIQSSMNAQIASATGLVGRFGLNEGTGTAAADSAAPLENGTLSGGAAWGAGVPAISSGTCAHAPVETCCDDNADCDDANPCTSDACEGATCENVPIGGCCATAADCADGDPCTTETCVNGTCDVDPVPNCCATDADCGDADVCTADFCPVLDPDLGSGGPAALAFDGSDDYVTMGVTPSLGATQFTVETWFQRTATGTPNTTGTSGIPNFVPLVAKGAPESDGSNVDANYVLGINDDGDVLAADFEDAATGLNHPISGSTPIVNGTWYHAAATYDGTTWRLYLNGNLEAQLNVGAFTPRADNVQPFGLGTMQRTASATPPLQVGFFAGLLDEVRVWNVVRTQSQMRASMHREVLTASGLIGRWGLNEGSGTLAHDATGGENGTLTNGPAWTLLPGDPHGFGTAGVCENDALAGCCLTVADCNDADSCTSDLCTDNVCSHPFIGGCCHASPECDDSNVCTTDSCGSNTCQNTPDTALCDDGNVCTTDVCSGAAGAFALAFDGTNDFVTFGTAAELGLPKFTIETWFRRTGTGTANTTGTNGIANLVPLLAKGAPEAEGSNVDANYILGISTAGNVLAADFEDTATGLNHPLSGTTAIVNDTWYHAAATYDGTTWRLYLNGNLEATGNVGAFTPRSDSIQPAVLGTMHRSAGAASPQQVGFFQGVLDEARVWNYARSLAEIQAGRLRQITSAPGLVARWGLNEGSGSSTIDAVAPASNGTLTNFTLPGAWVTGAPDLQPAECSSSTIAGCCVTAADCNDGSVCTTDTCVANACTFTPVPGCASCTTDAQCNDGSTCTADSCNMANDAAVDLGAASGDYVDLGQSAAANNYINNFGTSSFTIEGWFYARSVGTDLTGIFRAGQQGTAAQVAIQLRTGTSPWIATSVERSAGGAGTAQIDAPSAFAAAAAVTLNAWHHVALVMDRSAPQLRTYLDGALVGTATPAWNAADTVNMPAGQVSLLGAARSSTPALIAFLDGYVDEVRVWNFARTLAEIQADKNREIVAATGLVHRWGFNEATGPAIDDPGTFDGTFVGTAPRTTIVKPTFGDDLCLFAPANSGAACDDGNGCTTGTTCSAGACSGGTPITPPGEAQNVRVEGDKVTYVWDVSAAATLYDAVRGSLNALPAGPGGADEACFGDLATAGLVDAAIPPAGTGYWYLTRGQNGCGTGTYGTRSNGTPRSTTTCP